MAMGTAARGGARGGATQRRHSPCARAGRPRTRQHRAMHHHLDLLPPPVLVAQVRAARRIVAQTLGDGAAARRGLVPLAALLVAITWGFVALYFG